MSALIPARLVAAVLACAFVVAFAREACAQSGVPQPPTAPHESTQLSAPDANGQMLVDFSKPDAEPAQPVDAPTPDPTATTADIALRHTCSTGNAGIDAVVLEAGARFGVDPCLVTAVMSAESGYRRYAVSPKGACGYMQLMPETARRFGVVDLFDARQNIHAGTRYLRFLLDRFGGSVELALAGYNAGESAVERYGLRIPPYAETQNYVRTIAARYFG